MIATLTGRIDSKDPEQIVIDVAGVGYGVRVDNTTFAGLVQGQKAKLIIYEHIKEDAHDLYGFVDVGAKQFFELLLSVNGVGAKMAISIMNVGNQQELRAAIAGGDSKYIQAASGVGKRLAERVIVDLKDKVGLEASEEATSFLGAPSSADEAVQALGALGFTPQDAADALAGVDPGASTEERIKLALKNKRS